VPHLKKAEDAIVSFGQGCEGEPLLRADDIARAVSMAREKTGRGTIHMNTNGSLPGRVKQLADAGLDSIRVSLNSPTKKYYERYHRPVNYSFDDVMKTIDLSLRSGIFVSINLFFMPGFTDMQTEVESLTAFLKKFPVNMIQTRNLNIDPDYFFEKIGFEESEPVGIVTLCEMIKREFPAMLFGYYNPPKEKFGKKSLKK